MTDIISELYSNNEKYMKDLFEKYHNGINIFESTISCDIKNISDMNLYFSDYKIATMTVNGILPIDINCDVFVLILKDIDIINIDESKIKFYNSLTFKITINNNVLNVKYFKNGSLQVTGCKDILNVNKLVIFLINLIKENKEILFNNIDIDFKYHKFLEKKKIVELRNIGKQYNLSNANKYKKINLIEKIVQDTTFINDNNLDNTYNKDNIDKFDIKDANILISMINCSYQIFNTVNDKHIEFKLNRKKLFNFLKSNEEYKLSCYYDNTQHQGIKINIMYNSDMDGICKCSESCIILNKKKRKCKKITVLIFNSAKIVITGSNDLKQTKLAYDIINNIIERHYPKFVQLTL